MSNRLLALFILVVTIGGLIISYLYFFVFYGSTITSTGNVEDYKVSFKTSKLDSPVEFDCKDSVCVLANIAPFSYNITFSKEGYDSFSTNMVIIRRSNKEINFELKKEALLQKVSFETISEIDTVAKKIERIKYKKYFSNYDFGEDGIFYVKEYLDKLYLYRDKGEEKSLILTFDKITKNNINIGKIFSSDYFIIHINGKNYIYNNKTADLKFLDLKIKTIYGKKGSNNNELVFVTEKGSFLYDIKNNDFEYYYLFKDFVAVDNNIVLGVINSDEEAKLKNFNLISYNKNLLIKYDIKSKNKEILYETTDKIDKIYLKEEKVIFEINGDFLELKNY